MDDILSNINQMMDYFIPEDTESSDGAYHRQARQTMTEPIQTKDDIPFTKQEIQAALKKFDPRKAPGEDAINSEILLQVFRRISTSFTVCVCVCVRVCARARARACERESVRGGWGDWKLKAKSVGYVPCSVH